MRARIPLSGKFKRDALAEIRVAVNREQEKQVKAQVRRFFKLTAVVLNDEFGFGATRLTKLLIKFNELIKESSEDEIFWEHIDRQVIDRLGFDFERDYTR